jgi:hypothetical protein
MWGLPAANIFALVESFYGHRTFSLGGSIFSVVFFFVVGLIIGEGKWESHERRFRQLSP